MPELSDETMSARECASYTISRARASEKWVPKSYMTEAHACIRELRAEREELQREVERLRNEIITRFVRCPSCLHPILAEGCAHAPGCPEGKEKP